MASTPLSRSI
jgi:hypothetical protein